MPTGLCLGGAGLGSEDTTTMATSAPWKRKEVRPEMRRPRSFCKRVIQCQLQQETHMSLCCSREDLVPGPLTLLSAPPLVSVWEPVVLVPSSHSRRRIRTWSGPMRDSRQD